MEKQYKITDCNICPYLNMTEEEQCKRGCHIPHICTLYNTRVYHYSSKFNTYYYDPRLFPCDECKATYSFKDCTVGFWRCLNG